MKKMMSFEELKSAMVSWKGYFDQAENNLKFVRNIEETKENFIELKTLEMSYTYFVDQIGKIKNLYSVLMRMVKDKDLNKDEFLLAMKALQLANNDLRIEFNKKLFQELNEKYIESAKKEKTSTL